MLGSLFHQVCLAASAGNASLVVLVHKARLTLVMRTGAELPWPSRGHLPQPARFHFLQATQVRLGRSLRTIVSSLKRWLIVPRYIFQNKTGENSAKLQELGPRCVVRCHFRAVRRLMLLFCVLLPAVLR
jgi:hypothetical protein